MREEAATTHAGIGVAGSRADTGGGAYKSPIGKRIDKSDGGNRPSNRFPKNALQERGGYTPEASRLAV